MMLQRKKKTNVKCMQTYKPFVDEPSYNIYVGHAAIARFIVTAHCSTDNGIPNRIDFTAAGDFSLHPVRIFADIPRINKISSK
jgi:hypothetical protein